MCTNNLNACSLYFGSVTENIYLKYFWGNLALSNKRFYTLTCIISNYKIYPGKETTDKWFQDSNTFSLNSKFEFTCVIVKKCKNRLTKRGDFPEILKEANIASIFRRWEFLLSNYSSAPAGNYMFKVNNRNTRKRREICSKLAIKTSERWNWRRSGVIIFNFEHILHLVLLFLLLTLSW